LYIVSLSVQHFDYNRLDLFPQRPVFGSIAGRRGNLVHNAFAISLVKKPRL
jgi:hypothetical protein